MVAHQTSNLGVVGSSPTWDVFFFLFNFFKKNPKNPKFFSLLQKKNPPKYFLTINF